MPQKLSAIIFNSISDGVFTVDENCIITSFNQAAERITGFEASQAIGQHCFDVLRERLGYRKTLDTIVSTHPTIQEIKGLLPDVAASECSVLIQGPSGSGKELFAQVLHTLSPRSYGPYIKLNCAALPATLLESELFGYEKGAFTDAKKNKPGQFTLARGGTLLLDEISEMDVSLQVKLLRVLNDGEYRPLGATRPLHADVRILAATNADLDTAIAEGRFREDLYYRINVINLRIPPLRERPEDIPLLVDHFIRTLKAKTRKPIDSISPQALALLMKHDFPGNVRELENAIEHSFVMSSGSRIEASHLPQHICTNASHLLRPGPSLRSEMQIILQTLRRNNGNRARTARDLGMHRTTLWRKLKSYSPRAGSYRETGG